MISMRVVRRATIDVIDRLPEEDLMESVSLLDRAGRRRSPATLSSFHSTGPVRHFRDRAPCSRHPGRVSGNANIRSGAPANRPTIYLPSFCWRSPGRSTAYVGSRRWRRSERRFEIPRARSGRLPCLPWPRGSSGLATTTEPDRGADENPRRELEVGFFTLGSMLRARPGAAVSNGRDGVARGRFPSAACDAAGASRTSGRSAWPAARR